LNDSNLGVFGLLEQKMLKDIKRVLNVSTLAVIGRTEREMLNVYGIIQYLV